MTRDLARKIRPQATERDESGYNIRLLAPQDDIRLAQRFFARATVAFLGAAIGLVSALLIGVDDGIFVVKRVTPGQALGYLGLMVATVLGMRVLVASAATVSFRHVGYTASLAGRRAAAVAFTLGRRSSSVSEPMTAEPAWRMFST